jgi:pimeloyl-ACP methyl ester carboxylesterase
MPELVHDGLRLHYAERGDREGRPVVLIHGLLWSARMMERLASLLPDHRMVLIDLRGHGRSDRPTDEARYRWSTLASDVVALLDELALERAVVGGLSLGANVTLATADAHPDRVEAMVVEMPVLDRAEPAARRVFGGLARSLETGSPLLGPFARAVNGLPVPRRPAEIAALRDVIGADPVAAAALVRGLLSDSLLFADLHPDRLTMPTLVIGHARDPIHVLDDARQLAAVLPNARLIERSSIADYRVRPDLLAGELEAFLASLP